MRSVTFTVARRFRQVRVRPRGRFEGVRWVLPFRHLPLSVQRAFEVGRRYRVTISTRAFRGKQGRAVLFRWSVFNDPSVASFTGVSHWYHSLAGRRLGERKYLYPCRSFVALVGALPPPNEIAHYYVRVKAVPK